VQNTNGSDQKRFTSCTEMQTYRLGAVIDIRNRSIPVKVDLLRCPVIFASRLLPPKSRWTIRISRRLHSSWQRPSRPEASLEKGHILSHPALQSPVYLSCARSVCTDTHTSQKKRSRYKYERNCTNRSQRSHWSIAAFLRATRLARRATSSRPLRTSGIRNISPCDRTSSVFFLEFMYGI
jgi:hypothetical protein